MGDIERVLRSLEFDPGFTARVFAAPVDALTGYVLTVADLERVAHALRPTTSHLAQNEQRRLLGGLLFLMTQASAGLD